ncbi:hypothetical protein [Prevotella denticola]|uniref:hypothetical protein n=1 Tax=Prevotella denticola TaxID=28129 RepID=UPI0028E46B4C|nr:hypothetical protein [Prevotella denticola]
MQRYGENSFQPNVSRIIFQKNSKAAHSLDANQLNNAENASAINQEPSKQEKSRKKAKDKKQAARRKFESKGSFFSPTANSNYP